MLVVSSCDFLSLFPEYLYKKSIGVLLGQSKFFQAQPHPPTVATSRILPQWLPATSSHSGCCYPVTSVPVLSSQKTAPNSYIAED